MDWLKLERVSRALGRAQNRLLHFAADAHRMREALASTEPTWHTFSHDGAFYACDVGGPLHMVNLRTGKQHRSPDAFAVVSPEDLEEIRWHARSYHNKGGHRVSLKALDERRLGLMVHRHGQHVPHLSRVLPCSKQPRVGHHVVGIWNDPPHARIDRKPIDRIDEYPN